MVKIRDAESSEWKTIHLLTRDANREFASSADPEFWKRYEVSTETTLLRESDMTRIIAESDGQIAGAVLYCPPYQLELNGKLVINPYPEMRLLAVSTEFRNQGIGDKLITHCEEKALAQGFDYISLHTTSLMNVARAMYERRGYTRFPSIDFEPAPGFVVVGYSKKIS